MTEMQTASYKGGNLVVGPALVSRCDLGYSQRAEWKSVKMLPRYLTSGSGVLFPVLSFSRLIS